LIQSLATVAMEACVQERTAHTYGSTIIYTHSLGHYERSVPTIYSVTLEK